MACIGNPSKYVKLYKDKISLYLIIATEIFFEIRRLYKQYII